jgi:hypothetical protein
VASIDDLSAALRRGPTAAGASVPNLIAGLVRLNLFAVFLIYAATPAVESLRRQRYYFSPLVILSVSLFFAIMIAVFVKNWRAQWKKADVPAADLESVWMCAAPAAALIVLLTTPTGFSTSATVSVT